MANKEAEISQLKNL